MSLRSSSEMLIIKDDSFESFHSNPSFKHVSLTSETYSVNICLGVFFYLIWGVLFTIFTSNDNYYAEECEDSALMSWSKAIGVSNIICCIVSIFVIPGLLFYIEKKSRSSTVYSYYETVDSGMRMAVKLIKIMRLLLIMNFAILYVGALAVYSYEYYCKHLGTLMFSFILMCSVFIGVIVFMILMYLYNAYHKRIQSQELKYKYFQ